MTATGRHSQIWGCRRYQGPRTQSQGLTGPQHWLPGLGLRQCPLADHWWSGPRLRGQSWLFQ